MLKNPELVVDNSGFVIKGIQQYTPQETFRKCTEGTLLLDIRSSEMSRFKAFDVPKVLLCHWRKMDKFLDQIPKDQEIIVADAAGVNGMDVIRLLRTKGFDLLANMAGGLVEWERDDLPIRMDSSARLSGSCVCQLKPREKTKNQKTL